MCSNAIVTRPRQVGKRESPSKSAEPGGQSRQVSQAELAPGQVRVRHYADYLLDKAFANPADAAVAIIASLREIARANIAATG